MAKYNSVDVLIPVFDLNNMSEQVVQGSVKIYLEAVLATNSKRRPLPLTAFQEAIDELLETHFSSVNDEISYKNLIEWIHCRATHEIVRVDSNGLNITNAEANAKAKRDKTILYVIISVLTTPMLFAITVRFQDLPIVCLVACVIFICLVFEFGIVPKYENHIHLTAQVYGKLIYDILANPEQRKKQVEHYINQKRNFRSRRRSNFIP